MIAGSAWARFWRIDSGSMGVDIDRRLQGTRPSYPSAGRAGPILAHATRRRPSRRAGSRPDRRRAGGGERPDAAGLGLDPSLCHDLLRYRSIDVVTLLGFNCLERVLVMRAEWKRNNVQVGLPDEAMTELTILAANIGREIGDRGLT